ncbi:MAG TPA: M4 family metallopeptidase [Kribbella sp.]
MTLHHIVPPYLLEHLERTADDPNLRARYRQTLEHDAVFRSRSAAPPAAVGGGPKREIHDAEHETALPGRLVRSEGADPASDNAVNEAYDGTGATWTMFSECFARDSVDGAGLPLISTVHYDRDYTNAFWDGAQMVFGDGDGVIFRGFTSAIDVTGHELTHGVTQHTANLAYEGQSGALNESISDVFGSLTKQHHLGQSSADADWLIGAGIFLPGVQGVALRSLAAPGTAYDDPRLGKDPQPSHMSGYIQTTNDNGGVHLNSGIPNHAFYLVATALGGNAYDAPGRIWYATITSGRVPQSATFADFAQATRSAAQTLFGPTSPELNAVTTAWQEVGVLPTVAPPPSSTSPGPSSPAPGPSTPAPGPSSPGPSSPGSAGSAESGDLMRAAKIALNPSTPPSLPPEPVTPEEPGPDEGQD